MSLCVLRFDPKSGAKCEMQVVPCQIKHIHDVSALKLKNITKDLKKRKQRQKIWKTFKKMRKNYGIEENIPLIHPIQDMEIDDKKFKKVTELKTFLIYLKVQNIYCL